jgi:GNAT superfamily N-acetyltransferase
MQDAHMNPTFLNPQNFIVAEQDSQGNEKNTGSAIVAGFGQVRPVAGANEHVWELASVYVLPAVRGQGVGSQIVAKLVQNFCNTDKKAASPRRLVLLTLADTASFYTPHSFRVVPDPVQAQPPLPPLFVLEYLAGSVVARLSRGPGTKLVVMELVGKGFAVVEA